MPDQVIVVDWGTTNFRAWLVDAASGAVRDEIAHGKGLRDLTRDEFPAYCNERLARWRANVAPIYMSGMVGSPQGWQQAPQLPLPVAIRDLAANVVAAEGVEDAYIVPGCRRVLDGIADVMRGEEVQIFGALALSGRSDARLCLPGSHSKWARAKNNVLTEFTTAMTGEVYQALLEHTILGRPANRTAPFGERAFRAGLAIAGRDGGLLHHVFTARSQHLYGDLSPDGIASYLSGILIGHEIAGMTRVGDTNEPILLVCADALKTPYEIALGERGLSTQWIAAREATLAGALAVVRAHQGSLSPLGRGAG